MTPLAEPILNDSDEPMPLKVCVRQALDRYFRDLDGEEPADLYNMVIHEVEAPLLAAVMYHLRGNQSRAAKALGISRSTLRKKLQQHGIE